MSAKKASRGVNPRYRPLVYAVLASNGLSLLLYWLRVIGAQDFRYYFLFWNLALAWLPLGFALWLKRRLLMSRWLSAVNITLTLLWLVFLPNSFYILSDLIHLSNTGEVSVLFDAVLFSSFIFNGFTMGFMSLYAIHLLLIKRLRSEWAHGIIAVVILLCSFAIYLGRSLRWNTWDILVTPIGLLFDVSERIINPIAHPQAFVTTSTFFLLIGTMYLVLWQIARALRRE